MKYLLFLIPFLLNAQNLLLFDDDAVVDTLGTYKTTVYTARVVADGGEVIDAEAVRAFYKDAIENDYLDTLYVALLYTAGVKLSTTVITKWYNLSPNEDDFVTYYGLNPDYSAVNGVGSGTTPDFGANLTFTQPNSYYFIMKANGLSVNQNMFGGAAYQMVYRAGGLNLAVYAGSDFDITDLYTNNTFFFARVVFAGAASSGQINGGDPFVGNAGAQNVNADFLFFNTIPNTYFKCFVITKRLSATKDLALKNILNTIYPTY